MAKGQKPFALLRDVLRRTGYVGLGKVVIPTTKQHLAIVLPPGKGLVLNLLRWHEEIRDMSGLALPGDADDVGITARELKMGEQLVMDRAEEDFHPERFHDEYREKIEKLVEQRRDIAALQGITVATRQLIGPLGLAVALAATRPTAVLHARPPGPPKGA